MQCSIAVLQGVSVQAVVTEFLVRNADTLFTDSVQNDSTDVVTGQCIDKLIILIRKPFTVTCSDCLQWDWIASHQIRSD